MNISFLSLKFKCSKSVSENIIPWLVSADVTGYLHKTQPNPTPVHLKAQLGTLLTMWHRSSGSPSMKLGKLYPPMVVKSQGGVPPKCLKNSGFRNCGSVIGLEVAKIEFWKDEQFLLLNRAGLFGWVQPSPFFGGWRNLPLILHTHVEEQSLTDFLFQTLFLH